jgi:rare lipoprotein A
MPRLRKTKSYKQPMSYGKIFTSAPTTCLLLSFCAVFAGHSAAAEAQTSNLSIINSVTSSLVNQGAESITDKSSQTLTSGTSSDIQQAFPLEVQILNPAAGTVLFGNTVGQSISAGSVTTLSSPSIAAGLAFASKSKSNSASLCDGAAKGSLDTASKKQEPNSCQQAGSFVGSALRQTPVSAQSVSAQSANSPVTSNPTAIGNQTGKNQATDNGGNGVNRVASLASSPKPSSSSFVSNPVVSNAIVSNPANSVVTSSAGTNTSNSAASAANVAKIYAHTVDGKPAATVYVRGIPVMTFVEGESQPRQKDLPKDLPREANQGDKDGKETKDSKDVKAAIAQDKLQASTNPIERAAAVASLINQMNREGQDASKITPEWQSGNFVIRFAGRGTLRFDQSVRLPETTKETSTDVLESANLIRRLMGGASPLTAVLNAPPTANNAMGQVLQVASGIASWYGPGFAGNLSANGEIFDPEAMTAAHPNLPFGTMVRVINMDNGQSVVVRINDRGPYVHGRIIDISAGAARSIGMIPTGVAQVKLEILGSASR